MYHKASFWIRMSVLQNAKRRRKREDGSREEKEGNYSFKPLSIYHFRKEYCTSHLLTGQVRLFV